jgi:dipeptidyl aminopeptidase/acylaminoacyl peptidase
MVSDPRVRAVVLFAPVSTDMRDNSRKWWVNSKATGALGSPDDPAQKAAYDHISPRNYLEAKDPPALFLQGTLDQDIPAPWTLASYDAMQAAGIKTKLVWFPGAYHDMVGSDLDSAVTQAEAWVRQAIG